MESTNRLNHIFGSLVRYCPFWLIPAIIGFVLASVYAFTLMGESWTARQSMILRDDLLGDTFKPGQFLSQEAMMSAQETILETARRPEVVRETLMKLGPKSKSLFGGGSASWPSEEAVEDARAAITFQAANGGDIGKSEVIVLAANSSDRDRAVKFLSILLDEVDIKLAEFRTKRFLSMKDELMATRDRASDSLQVQVNKLQTMEMELRDNVSLLKSLNSDGGGSPSAFDNNLTQIKTEKREANRQLAAALSLKNALDEAQRNPLSTLSVSGDLLILQPALGGLLTNLSTAQEQLALAEATFGPKHPDVRVSRESVAGMQRKLREAVSPAIVGLEGQIRMLQDRVSLMDERIEENLEHLREISLKRVQYTSLEQEVKRRSEDLHSASGKLAEVQARAETAQAVQLLTRMGEPYVGTRPDGLGKKAIAILGGIAGLLTGLGLVLLVAPPFQPGSPTNPGNPLADLGSAIRSVTNSVTRPTAAPTMASNQLANQTVQEAPPAPTPPPMPAPAVPTTESRPQPTAPPTPTAPASPLSAMGETKPSASASPTPKPQTSTATDKESIAPTGEKQMSAAQLAAEILSKHKSDKKPGTASSRPAPKQPSPPTAKTPPQQPVAPVRRTKKRPQKTSERLEVTDETSDKSKPAKPTSPAKPPKREPVQTQALDITPKIPGVASKPNTPTSPGTAAQTPRKKQPSHDTISIDDLPLANRKPENIRPVDLAKAGAQPNSDGKLIDRVFSKLETDRKPREVETVALPADKPKPNDNPNADQTIEPARREVDTAQAADDSQHATPPTFVPRENIETVNNPQLPDGQKLPQPEEFQRSPSAAETALPPEPRPADLSVPQLIQRLKGSRTAFGKKPEQDDKEK